MLTDSGDSYRTLRKLLCNVVFGLRQVVCCFGACLMTLYLFALDILLAAFGISLHVNSGPGCTVTSIEVTAIHDY